ncbi:hypothetical protein A9Q99_02145 [Gammaproteobacteria bacterium 45_16_T64]|nr:hypothetical protein A9Q99_02145 [Gammaproteobacteria bacterium 45_16_T64]
MISRHHFCVIVSLMLTYSPSAFSDAKISGIVQLSAIGADSEESFIDGGTGRLLYNDDGIHLSQMFFVFSGDITDTLSTQIVGNHTQTPESRTGLTQAFLRYKPIPTSNYHWEAKAGSFYPALSFENVDIGWTSPFAYTNSAINTWIGEEIRINGLELSLSRKGNRRNNIPHSFSALLGVYKGNDPAGTVLAWRGFALHDKQTQLNENLPFANYPSIQTPPLEQQNDYVDVFREEDDRYGFYVGGHWNYKRKSKLRYYYYDNQADPLRVSSGQYAWHTKFHSVSWLYRPIKNWRFISQYLTGTTLMGPNAVYLGYESYYVLASYKQKKHRLTTRIDRFGTFNKNDILPEDDNRSQGTALTLTWRYAIDKSWQIGAEWTKIESTQNSREQFGKDKALNQEQFMLILQLRY